jgi:hypothetical protein
MYFGPVAEQVGGFVDEPVTRYGSEEPIFSTSKGFTPKSVHHLFREHALERRV